MSMFPYVDALLASSTGRLLAAFFVVFVSILASQVASQYMKHKALKNEDPAEKTRLAFIRHLVTACILILGFGLAIYMIPSLRKLAVSLFAGAGVLAIVVGFASQKALANIVAGIFITIYKPYRIGDWIDVNGSYGIVEDITLRHTIIRDFEYVRIIIPNSVISEATIQNKSIIDEKVRKHIVVGISYNSDVDAALLLMRKICEKHPSCLDMRTPEEKKNKVPVVTTRLIKLNDSSVDLKAWVWASDPDTAFEMSCDLYRDIKVAFEKYGIEIPYPHRTIYLRQDKKHSKAKK